MSNESLPGDKLEKLFSDVFAIIEEGGPRADKLKANMQKSLEEGKEKIRRSEEALNKLRCMSEEDWWEECYQKGILGSGAPSEWLEKRKMKEMV